MAMISTSIYVVLEKMIGKYNPNLQAPKSKFCCSIANNEEGFIKYHMVLRQYSTTEGVVKALKQDNFKEKLVGKEVLKLFKKKQIATLLLMQNLSSNTNRYKCVF